MNNDQVNQIIQGLGAMVEMWSIVYKGFQQQGMDDSTALAHTKAFMSVAMNGVLGTASSGEG